MFAHKQLWIWHETLWTHRSSTQGSDGASGFGFELTFRLKREDGETGPPTWPAALMQALARYVFQSENTLCAGNLATLYRWSETWVLSRREGLSRVVLLPRRRASSHNLPISGQTTSQENTTISCLVFPRAQHRRACCSYSGGVVCVCVCVCVCACVRACVCVQTSKFWNQQNLKQYLQMIHYQFLATPL